MIPIDLDAEPPREVRPHWLGAGDHGWLVALVDVFQRHDGRRRHELDAALRLPLVVPSPHRPRRIAEGVLGRLVHTKLGGPPLPLEVRDRVFRRAADRTARAVVLAEVAASLATTVEVVEASLFADLPSERRMVMPPEWPPPFELATRVNQATARIAIQQSVSVRLELFGESRRVVRVARLRGLLTTVRSGDEDDDVVLDLSGPYSLLRATTVYGRALSSIVPHLVHTSRFVLRATGKNGAVTRIERTDPIFDEARPPPCDSAIESAFVTRFQQATVEWDLVREPEPVAAGASLVFPDFALVHRRTGRRWLLEIVGFWTPEYLTEKLASLRRAKIENLILCLSDELRCGAGELPTGAIVVPFKKRVDPSVVLQIVERL